MALKGAGGGANATACRREPVTETLSSVASDAISAATSGDGEAVGGCDDTCSSPTVLQADRARMQSRALASAWRCMGVSRGGRVRSEEHTSELQSLMRISYAVFCLEKKTTIKKYTRTRTTHIK